MTLTFFVLKNSNLIEPTEKCSEKLLIWNSYKSTTVGTQSRNRNAVLVKNIADSILSISSFPGVIEQIVNVIATFKL